MHPDQVKQLLLEEFSDCDVTVESDGSHFNLVVVGDCFEGLRAVQRQQKVYAALSEQIASGAMHAVNIKTFTTSEWQQR
ncbi:MAG: BolA/IbaG family iron-sulfur metabolism protein [Porticoccaceae bacterium]|nr:BolA/IbaG family iron-sulfur metabolism protein [Pseudomonadales bacterium]MCP5172594.1 BolA/IbaG family iron-sulfur metabolism protein [Pseudomonadales bacterium]MCP5303510.1 BolA/IbaG family iron-sulfur metabolism protein [Pseudomonadales bacterium]